MTNRLTIITSDGSFSPFTITFSNASIVAFRAGREIQRMFLFHRRCPPCHRPSSDSLAAAFHSVVPHPAGCCSTSNKLVRRRSLGLFVEHHSHRPMSTLANRCRPTNTKAFSILQMRSFLSNGVPIRSRKSLEKKNSLRSERKKHFVFSTRKRRRSDRIWCLVASDTSLEVNDPL